jgi:hypothetical protein
MQWTELYKIQLCSCNRLRVGSGGISERKNSIDLCTIKSSGIAWLRIDYFFLKIKT